MPPSNQWCSDWLDGAAALQARHHVDVGPELEPAVVEGEQGAELAGHDGRTTSSTGAPCAISSATRCTRAIASAARSRPRCDRGRGPPPRRPGARRRAGSATVSTSSAVSMSIDRYGRVEEEVERQRGHHRGERARRRARRRSRRPPRRARGSARGSRCRGRVGTARGSARRRSGRARRLPGRRAGWPVLDRSSPSPLHVGGLHHPPSCARIDAVADHSYSFRSVWTPGAPAGDIYQALERLADYPAWWPEIKEVRPLEQRGVRAALPVGAPLRPRVHDAPDPS